MKQTINNQTFLEAFKNMGRGDQFSRAGLEALYDHIEECEEDTGQEMELDVIALCCDYLEHETALECAMDHGFDPDKGDDEDDQEKAALEWLHGRTTVIDFDGGIIVQQF